MYSIKKEKDIEKNLYKLAKELIVERETLLKMAKLSI